MKFYILSICTALSFGFTACQNAETQTPISEIQAEFFAGLKTLCGQTVSGSVVSEDPEDEDWRQSKLVVGPVSCTRTEIRLPLAVGANTSRTWIVTKQADHISLKHDHRHADGTPDSVTNYGGFTKTRGSTVRQEFPVDPFSVDLFKTEGLEQSVTNIWALEIQPGQMLSYELSRAGRFFRTEFPLP